MHLYALTRGIKFDVDRMVEGLSAMNLPYGRGLVQLAMRPVQLWEMVFPEKSLPVVLKSLSWNNVQRKEIKPHVFALRKLLGAKPLPKFDFKKFPSVFVYHNNVGFYPIGIKHDKLWPKGHALEGLEQL